MPKIQPISIDEAISKFKTVTRSQNGYNKVGARLVSKANLTGDSLKMLNLPKKVHSIKVVNIESGFGKVKTRIISYFNKSNELLSRRRTINDGVGETVINSSYNKTGEFNKNNQLVNFFDVLRSKIFNGKPVSNNRLMVSVPMPKNSDITLSRLVTKMKGEKLSFEKQIIQSYKRGNPKERKFLVTEGYHNNSSGNVFLTDIYGNINDKEKFISDPYIMTRMYPNEDFTLSTFNLLSKKFGVNDDKLNLTLKYMPSCTGSYAETNRELCIDPFFPKLQIVSTTAHELRHALQHKYINAVTKSCKTTSDIAETTPQRINKIAKRLKRANNLYWMNLNGFITPLYEYNYMEVDARKCAKRWLNQYEKLSDSLHSEFPNAAGRQFGLELKIYMSDKSDTWYMNRAELFENCSKTVIWPKGVENISIKQ